MARANTVGSIPGPSSRTVILAAGDGASTEWTLISIRPRSRPIACSALVTRLTSSWRRWTTWIPAATPVGGEGGDEDEPEPVPVPYVGDIWPNATPTGAGNGKPDPAVNYAVGLGDDPQVRGPDNALVTIVMFGDFQCPYCKRVLGTVDEVMAKYGKDVRLVFRHNPLAMHSEAKIAARAAIAAGRQGKFWGMHDKLYDNQHALTEDNFRGWADELGLDVVKFDRDYADRFSTTQVEADMAEATKFGARVTPSFFVNGRYLAGAQPLHAFETVIDEEMERAKKFVERRGNTRKRLYEDMVTRFAGEVTKPPKAPIATPTG